MKKYKAKGKKYLLIKINKIKIKKTKTYLNKIFHCKINRLSNQLPLPTKLIDTINQKVN